MNGAALIRSLCRRRDEMLTQELNRFMEAHTAKPCNGIIYEATRNLNFAWDGKLISECLSARKRKKKFLAKDIILRVNAIGVNLSRSASSDEQEKLRIARFLSSQCHSTRSCHDPGYNFLHPSRQTSFELRQHLMLQSEMKRLSQSGRS